MSWLVSFLTWFSRHAATIACLVLVPTRPGVPSVAGSPAGALHVEVYTADSTSLDVNTVVISGPSEALIIDAQYSVSDARHVADMIARSGKRLQAIFITHPHNDHYLGAAVIVARFPGTPVYMTAAARDEFAAHEIPLFKSVKPRISAARASEFPDSLITPRVLESPQFTIDGVVVQVIPDLQGDMETPLNSVVWIPSLRTVISGDIVFSGVHPWLAESTVGSRQAWLASLRRIADLDPRVVIPGHQAIPNVLVGPDEITAQLHYLLVFDAALKVAATPDALVNAVRQQYPALSMPAALTAAARSAFKR